MRRGLLHVPECLGKSQDGKRMDIRLFRLFVGSGGREIGVKAMSWGGGYPRLLYSSRGPTHL